MVSSCPCVMLYECFSFHFFFSWFDWKENDGSIDEGHVGSSFVCFNKIFGKVNKKTEDRQRSLKNFISSFFDETRKGTEGTNR